jgi:murein DD-endopeptidase MepM/ murein hydrolase activator NlpD
MEKQIQHNKNKVEVIKKSSKTTKIKIKQLSTLIKKETKELNSIVKKIKKLDKIIKSQKRNFNQAKKKFLNFNQKSQKLQRQEKRLEDEIVDTTISQFSSTLAVDFIKKESFKDLVNYEIYNILIDEYQEDIIKLNTSYLSIRQNKDLQNRKISKISRYIQKVKKQKQRLQRLKRTQAKVVNGLNYKHKLYQKHLKQILKNQDTISNLLSKLDIIKKQRIETKKIALKKRQKRLNEIKRQKRLNSLKDSFETGSNNLSTQKQKFIKDIEVKNIGSSIKGIKITKYRGYKGRKPLQSYKITKKFGKYFDKLYGIELFNDSITLQSKKSNVKVHSIFSGKVIYAKLNSGILNNVVIIQHKHGLHTVYSHLSKIPKSLKVGQYISKGYVVGRIKNELVLQATKNNAYINPKELF